MTRWPEHHRTHARRDGRGEGHQFHLAQHLLGAGQHRQGRVRVLRRRAVAGKVLGAGRDAAALQPADPRFDLPRGAARIRAERAHADDRVEVGQGQVGARREVRGDARRDQTPAEGGRDLIGQLRVGGDAERVVAGYLGPSTGVQPGDVAAFLVDRHHRVVALLGDTRRQRGHLLVVDHVAAEQQHAAEAVAHPATHPVRRGRPGEPGQQHAGGQRPQFRVGPIRTAAHPIHPFTAPAVTPATRFRCTIRKNTTTGTVNRVDAAMVPPQSVLNTVWNVDNQTGRVNLSLSCMNTSA